MLKKCCYLLSLVLMLITLPSCATQSTTSWQRELYRKVHKYEGVARRHLQPYFERAGVPYPPRKLAFLIFKSGKKLEVYAKNTGRWHYIRTYRVLAASGGPGPKLHSGDYQVPEGIYHIIGLNPDSRFDLSMHLNYPNAFDRRMARNDHRHHLGDNIFIHGNHLSVGCIAIGNYAIQQLFPLVAQVGIKNVIVVIAPDDFRLYQPVYGRVRPRWLPMLYARIRRELKQFPVA